MEELKDLTSVNIMMQKQQLIETQLIVKSQQVGTGIDRMMDWLMEWFMNWLIDLSIRWMIYPLSHSFNHPTGWLMIDWQIMELKGKEDKSFNLFIRLVGWFIKLIWRSWGFMQSTL